MAADRHRASRRLRIARLGAALVGAAMVVAVGAGLGMGAASAAPAGTVEASKWIPASTSGGAAPMSVRWQ